MFEYRENFYLEIQRSRSILNIIIQKIYKNDTTI